MQRFYTRPHVPMEIIKVFFLIFRLPRILQAKKTSEKDHLFYNTAIQPKTFLTLQIFQHTCFCLVPEKNICTAPFLDA